MVDRAEFTWRLLHRKRKTKASTGCLCCIPFLLEAAAVLAAFVHWHASPAQSHSVSMLMGIHSFAAYLQLQVVWVYLMLAYADLSWKTLSSIVSFTSG
ncbi:hypothetical protein FR267_06325 [Vibrio vulnificus]|nr:hypothetical protein [Vibrio vulnificus]